MQSFVMYQSQSFRHFCLLSAAAIKIKDPIDGTMNFRAGEMTYRPYQLVLNDWYPQLFLCRLADLRSKHRHRLAYQ